jgi:hypothetical protein
MHRLDRIVARADIFADIVGFLSCSDVIRRLRTGSGG